MTRLSFVAITARERHWWDVLQEKYRAPRAGGWAVAALLCVLAWSGCEPQPARAADFVPFTCTMVPDFGDSAHLDTIPVTKLHLIVRDRYGVQKEIAMRSGPSTSAPPPTLPRWGQQLLFYATVSQDGEVRAFAMVAEDHNGNVSPLRKWCYVAIFPSGQVGKDTTWFDGEGKLPRAPEPSINLSLRRVSWGMRENPADWPRVQELVQLEARAALCREYGFVGLRGVRDSSLCHGIVQ